MKKANGKTESEMAGLDLEHELPPADGDEDPAGSIASGVAPGDSSALSAELQKLKAERDSLLDRLARAQAEFENARRRASKEQQDFRDYAAADAITPLMLVMSDLGDFRSGFELIYKQLQDALAKAGVKAIPAKGEQFDPHVHEAIEMVETTDAADHE